MSHGKRYTALERKKILDFLEAHTYDETMKEYNVSQMTLARWVKRMKNRRGRLNDYIIKPEQIPEIQLFLNMLELLEEIKDVFLISSTGQLVKASSSQITEHSDLIFQDPNGIVPLVSKLFANTEEFTHSVFQNLQGDEKSMELNIFSEIVINTSQGVVLVSGLGSKAAVMIIFEEYCKIKEIYSTHYHYINQILTGLEKKLE